MSQRIFGLETEFGCLTNSGRFRTAEGAASRVKDFIFGELSLGISDMHYRDWEEPPHNGGFLFNGGRLYMDMGHLEYATPECLQLFDLVAYDRAVEQMVCDALDILDLKGEISFLKNNIDHVTGSTFGCHENYQLRRDVPFYKLVIPTLMPFFVTRQIFSGAGRVGGHDELVEYGEIRHKRSDFVGFQISQRADHIVTEVYEWIQFSRAIINTRDEPLGDYTKYRRLHLLVGDSNMSEYATALKLGTTSLVLDLLEEGHTPPDLTLDDAIFAIKDISRDQSYRWLLTLASGRTITAVELQWEYLRICDKILRGRDKDTDWVLDEWASTLTELEPAYMNLPENLIGKVDWVTKQWLLETFMEEEKIGWEDSWLESLDLEYHNIDPEAGLFYELEEQGYTTRIIDDEQVQQATLTPPQDTRAKARSAIMNYLAKHDAPCIVDWHQIYFADSEAFDMKNAFRTYEAEVQAHLEKMETKRLRGHFDESQ